MKELISREQMIKEIGNINIKKLEENKETNEQLNGKDKILADLRENINFLEKNISEHKTELFNVIEEQNKKFNKICDRLYEIKDLTREECLNKGIDYNNVLDEIIDLKNQFDKYEPLDLSNLEIENVTKENVTKYVIKDEINDQRIKYNNLLEEYKEKLDEKEQVKNERKKLLDSLSNLNEPSEEKTKEETNELNNERITSINDTLAAIENELNNLKTSDMTQPNISLEQSNPLTEESLSEEQNEPLLSTEPNLEEANKNLSTSINENLEQDNNALNTEVSADNTNTSVKKSPVIISAKISNIAMTKMGKIDQLRNVFFKNQQNGYNVLRKKIENNTNTISAPSTSNSIENNTQQLENTATPLNTNSENSKIISLETFKNQMNNSNASSSMSNEKIISLDDLRKNTLQNSTDSNPSGGNAINNEAKSLTLKAA